MQKHGLRNDLSNLSHYPASLYEVITWIRYNSPHKSVQVCENVRQGNRVRQQVVRHVGIAQNDIHLIELKKLAKAIKNQILEERKGPFLWSKDSEERGAPCGLPKQTTQSDPLAGQGPEGAPHVLPSDPSTPKLPVDLYQLREKQRVVEGFHELF